jgi:hypothetical protein
MNKSLTLMALVGLFGLNLLYGQTAEAAQAPNYQKYCSTYHKGSFPNSFRATGEPICTKRTSRLSMMHYRVNVGEACRLTTGSRAFRRTGRGKYLCLGKGGAPRVTFPDVAPNYRKYCQTYHRGSFVNTLRATQEKICTTRTSQYRMVHNRINLAEACRLTTGKRTFRRYGPGKVRCTR